MTDGDNSASVGALFISHTWIAWRHRLLLAHFLYRQMKRQVRILKL